MGAVSVGEDQNEEIIYIHNMKERKKFLLSEKITYRCWNKLYRRELIDNTKVQYAEHVIYEEIKMYFLHTYLFETLYFAKKRSFTVSLEQFRVLINVVCNEVPDYAESCYASIDSYTDGVISASRRRHDARSVRKVYGNFITKTYLETLKNYKRMYLKKEVLYNKI